MSQDITNDVDTPVTGRAAGFRVRTHPAFDGTGRGDPLDDRLLALMRLHPTVVAVGPGDLAGMDAAAKRALIAQFAEALGSDAAAKEVISI